MHIGRITVLCILTTLLMTPSVMAQNPLKELQLGIKTGIGVSTLSDYDGESKSRTGYLAGIYIGYKENPFFTLQFELLYISKGYKLDDVIERDSLGNIIAYRDLEYIFNYLEVPILAKITPMTTGKYRPYIMAGGFAAYGVNNKLRLLGDIPFDFDLENDKKVDFGLIAGAGLDMKAGNGVIFLESRFDLSFGKPVKNESQKFRMLTFQIGYGW